eukprot:TRINITY_DN12168_c0_g1_i1.p2 TRINITY_DN12168_c0_g1~~TRINITY_DN12168_c0_g1_i1.p2  ORF type:complete len:131 (+),score=34.57 TRINITY_DN12168_c0_g1_i1:85-477(+)
MGTCTVGGNTIGTDHHIFQWNLMDEDPIATEECIGALEQFQWEKVNYQLEGGIKVNDPQDAQGHTMMDIYARSLYHSTDEIEAMKAKGDPQVVSRIYFETMDKAHRTLAVLRKHGAVFAGRTGALKKGLS